MRLLQKYIIVLLIFALFSCKHEIPDENISVIETGINSATWVKIPAGKFYKGMHEHETFVEYNYEIMITDVTNQQYAAYLNEAVSKKSIFVRDSGVYANYPGDKFRAYNHEVEIKAGDKLLMPLNETGQRILYENNTFIVKPGFENHPAVMVSWFGAKAYADFYAYRLPTENEWEKAVRGESKNAYPWGNEINPKKANFILSRKSIKEIIGNSLTTPVGFYNGKNNTEDSKSPYGLYDAVGNVWQWCGDVYPNTHNRYMRGGAFDNYDYNLRVWARNNAGPDFYAINIGFRCVR